MSVLPIVLIVDDEPPCRDTLEALLTNQGMRLLFAANGRDAIDMARAEPPDLVLLDVMMPEMDGFEVCAKLRDDPVLAEVPIILVTALDDRGSRIRGIENGADDFIVKPYDRIELRTRIRTLLRLNRYRRLHQERVKFDWVVEHADDGYLTLDRNGKMTYANAAARRELHLPTNAPRRDFWITASSDHVVVGRNLNAAVPSTPIYMVRPETPNGTGVWFFLEQFTVPGDTSADSVIRLHDITEERRMRQSLWSFRTTQKHKIRVSVSKSQQRCQTAESGRGAKHDETIPVLQTWVEQAGPPGSTVAVHGPMPDRGLVIPFESFALVAVELIAFARKPMGREAGPARFSLRPDETHEHLSLTLRVPCRDADANELARIWSPNYRIRKDNILEDDDGHPAGEAASLVWNIGGRVETRVDSLGAWAEVELIFPYQLTELPVLAGGGFFRDGDSLFGGSI